MNLRPLFQYRQNFCLLPCQNINELHVLPIALSAAGQKKISSSKNICSIKVRERLMGRKRTSQVVSFSARHFRGESEMSEIHGVTGNGKIKLQEGRICNVIIAKGCLNSGHPRDLVG